MELVTRSSALNSLWSVVYCVIVLVVHGFITYLGISKYRKLNDDALWGGETPPELRTYIALVVLALLFSPLFIFFSLLKVGNTANDGTKLGRDHALDNNANTLGAKIKWKWVRRLWEQFPPFSPLFHLLSAFLVLLPEVILTAAEVKYGIMASGWYILLNVNQSFSSLPEENKNTLAFSLFIEHDVIDFRLFVHSES